MSNYLASGLSQGFETGSRLYENKKKRKQEEELETARMQLQLDRDAAQTKKEKDMQDADLTFRGTLANDERLGREVENTRERGFKSGEAEKERGYRTGERIDAQGFHSSESELDRAAKVLAQDKDLKQRMDIQDIELPLKGAQLGMQARHQDWLENPDNPQNMSLEQLATYREAAAAAARAKQDDLSGVNNFTINGGAPSPSKLNALRPPPQVNGGRPQMANGPVRSPQDQQALLWAQANPNDPRAKAILERLGVRQ